MIKTVALEKIFRTEEVETLALNKVSIEVKEGEFVAIMGPSGCGKSTLLNILGLLDNPTSGEYYLNGIEVSDIRKPSGRNCAKGLSVRLPKFQSDRRVECIREYRTSFALHGCYRLPSERKRYRSNGTDGDPCTAKSISRSSCPAASNSVSPLPAP